MMTLACKTITSLNELWGLIMNNACEDSAFAICILRILLEYSEAPFSSIFMQPGWLQPTFLKTGGDSPVNLCRPWLHSKFQLSNITALEKAVRAGKVYNLPQSICFVYISWMFHSPCSGFTVWDVILRFSWMRRLPYMVLFFGGF